jgi:hypothetical protein
MACCALAAFLVSQLLVALDFLRERVLGLAPARVSESASAAWRLGDAPAPLPGGLFSPRRVALGAGAAGVAFAIAWTALDAGAARRPHPLEIPYLCASSASVALD